MNTFTQDVQAHQSLKLFVKSPLEENEIYCFRNKISLFMSSDSLLGTAH